jgi:caffeoyl-CoA O-methyltransferase
MQFTTPLLDTLSQQPETLASNWCVPPVQGQLMALLARLHQCKHVLEVGTSIGFSGLWFLLGMEATQGQLTSIDASAERQTIAQQHFTQAGIAPNRVTLLQGEALPILHQLVETPKQPHFDLLFLDAKKSQYYDYWQVAMPLLSANALVLADNTTSHRQAMFTFIQAITNSPDWLVMEWASTHGLLIAQRQA